MANLRLGQLLVDARMLSQQALDDVLEQQSLDGRRLGTLLVERGLINETQLTQILSHQLSVPWVALVHIEFSRQLLNLVPLEIAEAYCLVPIYVRHVRGQGDTLYVAMDDPTNDEPLRECMKYSGLPVRPMIAPPSDIREAIRVCYGVDIEAPHSKAALGKAALRAKALESTPSTMRHGADESTQPSSVATQSAVPDTYAAPRAQSISKTALTEPPPPSEVIDEATLESPSMIQAPITPRVVVAQSTSAASREGGSGVSVVIAAAPEMPAPAMASAPSPQKSSPVPYDDTPVVEAHEIEIPRSKRGRSLEHAPASETGPSSRRGPRSQRMISVTLLDGTTLALPAQPGRAGSALQEEDTGKAAEATPVPENEAAGNTLRALIGRLREAAGMPNENARTEAVLAATLSVLLKKHLVTEQEIHDELRKS